MSIRLTIFCIFAIVLGQCITANAQTVQPQYVRPSKGAAVQILSRPAVDATTTYTASAIFDWTAFAGVIVTVNAPTPPPPATACQFGVRVKALGGTNTTRSEFFLLNVANNDYRASTSQSWYIRVLPNYLTFAMESYEAAPTGATCTGAFKVTITPLPIDYSGQLVSTGVVADRKQPNESLDPFPITFDSSLPYTRLQNFATTAAYCTPIKTDGTYAASALDWPIRLKAATASNAGDGGVIEVSSWVGTMMCLGNIGIFQH